MERKNKFPYQVIFYNSEDIETREIIDSEYYQEEPTDMEITELMVDLESSYSECFFDKYDDESYTECLFDTKPQINL